MPDKRFIALPAAAALGLALVAGGAGASGDVTAALSHKATVRADPDGAIAFTKKRLKVRHGKVTIVMRNPGSSGIDHGIGVSGHGKSKTGKTVSPGDTSRVRIKLKKGKYTFFCPVPGHREIGMKGRLIVK